MEAGIHLLAMLAWRFSAIGGDIPVVLLRTGASSPHLMPLGLALAPRVLYLIHVGAAVVLLIGIVLALILRAAHTRKSMLALQRRNRALTVLNTFNAHLPDYHDDATLLSEACRIIVEVGSYRMAWVGIADANAAKSVRPVTKAGWEKGYLDTANVCWDAEDVRGNGPGGSAARTGEVIIVRDVYTDPTFVPWREEAIARGYASVITLPLCATTIPCDVLLIYAAETDAFDADEVVFLQEFSHNLIRGRMMLAERQRQQETTAQLECLITQAPFGMVMFDQHLICRHINDYAAHYSGHTVEEGLGSSLEDYLTQNLPTELAQHVVDDFRQGLTTGEPLVVHERPMSWAARAGETIYEDSEVRRIIGPYGEVLGVLLTLVDGLGRVFRTLG